MKMKTVEFTYHHGKHSPGDRASLPNVEADLLIRAKRAVEAKPKASTKPKATKATKKAALANATHETNG